MDLISTISALFLPLFFVFGCAFYMQRIRCKRGKQKGRKRSGFCPGYSSLGNALQELQRLTRPSLEYVLEEKKKDEADQDDEGGPETMPNLGRQLKKIRNGERLDRLTVYREGHVAQKSAKAGLAVE
jgi:hypothetical protein